MSENKSFWQRPPLSRNKPSLTRRKGFIAITDLPDYAPSQNTTLLSPKEASIFWQKHFGSPPRTPLLHVREEWLEADLAAGAIGMKLTDNQGEIIGTIWARPIGNFYVTKEPQHQIPILYVEGLCLKPEVRGKGYTRQLLNALGTETMKRYGPEMRFLFLKEGHSIPTSTLGFDLYIYKRFSHRDTLSSTIKTPLELDKAKEIFRALTQKKNSGPYLTNFGTGPTENSRTQLFTDPTESCLLAITETFQHHHLDGRRLGLITGWIADPDLPIETHAYLQQYVLARQPYTWIWSPTSYIIDNYSWHYDGAISFQPFEWWCTPTFGVKRLFIML